jgi:uncharacterized SAM-binding protein YcdF (DUF218 family)
MFLFLSKLLPLLVYPVGITSMLLVAALVLHRRRRLALGLQIAALLVLVSFSSQWVSHGLARSLEWQYLPQAELPEAEIIVLLGGGTRAALPPRPMTELNEAGERMLYAAKLYHEGKAPVVVVTGGYIEWLGTAMPEADGMQEILMLAGVPEEVIWLESRARNTYENAIYVKEIVAELGIQRIILVTSAMHMPRSVAIFERQGFEVIPAPVDYTVTMGDATVGSPDLGTRLLFALPDAEYLFLSTRALREYIGIVMYRLQGWL